MTRLEDIIDGHVYNFQFGKSDFTSAGGLQTVVVLINDYAGSGEKTRALIAKAQVNGSEVKADLDELYTVPVAKLTVIHPLMKPAELKKAMDEIKKRIDRPVR